MNDTITEIPKNSREKLVFTLAEYRGPEFKRARILSDEQFRLVLVLFAADIGIFAFAFAFNYVPPLAQYLLAIVAVYLLYVLAQHLSPTLVSARHDEPSWKPWKFFFLGLLLIGGGFLISTASYTREIHPIGTIALLMALATGVLLLLQHKMGRTNNEPHKASFAAGLPWLDLYQASRARGWSPRSRRLLLAALAARESRRRP